MPTNRNTTPPPPRWGFSPHGNSGEDYHGPTVACACPPAAINVLLWAFHAISGFWIWYELSNRWERDRSTETMVFGVIATIANLIGLLILYPQPCGCSLPHRPELGLGPIASRLTWAALQFSLFHPAFEARGQAGSESLKDFWYIVWMALSIITVVLWPATLCIRPCSTTVATPATEEPAPQEPAGRVVDEEKGESVHVECREPPPTYSVPQRG